ncbi:uncharacterized protein LOC118742075 [Rhagoletis pomonella]|uniref:uncharacterized protein LOC118742075 n=1 Tax=Rhagoletis pomonella TaxID=28610 RepID=UPI00177C0334|nr:uncharacterized protein LOC118742075 [Rhagoletis pomonella]
MSSATIALGHKNPSHTTSGTQQQPKSNSNQIKSTSCNKNSNNMSNAISNQQLLSNSTTNLSDSRSNLTNPAAAPTPCQRLSEMFRRSIASSVQSSSRENTYEELNSLEKATVAKQLDREQVAVVRYAKWYK